MAQGFCFALAFAKPTSRSLLRCIDKNILRIAEKKFA
jgi:hypothetical protein